MRQDTMCATGANGVPARQILALQSSGRCIHDFDGIKMILCICWMAAVCSHDVLHMIRYDSFLFADLFEEVSLPPRPVRADTTFPWRPNELNLISFHLEKEHRGFNLWVESSVKPFHNEVRVMPCAPCVQAWVKCLQKGLLHAWAH